MVSDAPAPVFVLNAQLGFECRRSGACCSAGWHIPVDRPAQDRLAIALGDGRLRLPGCRSEDGTGAWLETQHPPEGATGVLKIREDGACIWLERDAGHLCAIQRQLGHDALPTACQQFPRVTLIDDRGAHVTLSHCCPTAAAMLFRPEDEALAIILLHGDDPARRRVEGFDARGAVPPFLRPGVAFDMPSHDAWERGVVRALGRKDRDADARLAGVAAAAEGLRAWRPARGPLIEEVGRALGSIGPRSAAMRPPEYAAVTRLYEEMAASVPGGLQPPACPPGWESIDRRLIAPVWPRFSPAIGRFLAAKAFASQVAWQGHGVRTQVVALAAARAALRVEAARLAADAGRLCDEAILLEAARAADALIEHLSDRPVLVRGWAMVERLPRAAFLARLGLGLAA